MIQAVFMNLSILLAEEDITELKCMQIKDKTTITTEYTIIMIMTMTNEQ